MVVLKRWRRRLPGQRSVAGVLVGLVVVLTSVFVGTQPASALPPISPVAVPSAFSGAASTGGVAGPQVAGIVMAGIGAYQGTCYLAGVLSRLDGGAQCSSGVKTIINWLFDPVKGDNRDKTPPNTTTDGNCYIYVNSVVGTSETLTAHCNRTTWQANTVHLEPTSGCASSQNFLNAAANPTTGARDYVGTIVQTGGCGFRFNGATLNSAAYLRDVNGNYLAQAINIAGAGTGGLVTGVDVPVPWTYTWSETCRLGATTVTVAAPAITFTPSAGSKTPDPVLPSCDSVLAGSHLDNLSGTGGRNGVPEFTVTQPSFTAAATASYPLCTSALPAGGSCFLDLKKSGQSCFSGVTFCAGWTLLPAATMECLWGPYVMALSVCTTEYGTKFDTQTQPDPGASPTSTVAAPAPFPTTGTNIDPKTGLPVTGVTAGPAADLADDSSNCLGGGWGYNPVNWVYIPIKCAAIWAFKPDSTVLTAKLASMNTSLRTHPPFSVLVAASAFVVGMVTSVTGGCSGALAAVDASDTIIGQNLVIPCNPPNIAGLATARVLVITCIVFGTGVMIWRDIDATLHP